MEKLSTIKKNSQPSKIKTCGSTFKNPTSQTQKKAWELIKEARCENMKVGGASISKKHSNFFVNENFATSNDMENLIGKRPFKSSHIDLNDSNNQEDNDSNNQMAKNEEDRTSTEEK